MSEVFDSLELGPTERLIMLALADHADDDGRCYPSIPRLCQRTGLGERSIQSNIRKLQNSGHLRIVPGGGRSRPNLYIVTPNPASAAEYMDVNPAAETPFLTTNPAAETPFENTNPAFGALNPAFGALNPAADAPEPSRSIKEPISNPRDEVRSILCEVVSPDVADLFIQHRRDKRAKLTTSAARLIAGKLSSANRCEADDAIRRSVMNGWTGVFPETRQPPQSSRQPSREEMMAILSRGPTQ